MQQENLNDNRLAYNDPEYPVSVVYTDLGSREYPESRWQWHEDIKVIIINNGSAQINSDDQSLHISPGQAVIISPNVMHSIQQVGQETCSFYSIVFHLQFILGSAESGFSRKYADILESHNIKFMVFDENIEWHSELLDQLNSAIAANLLKFPGYEITTKGYLCLFWSTLIKHIDEETPGEGVEQSASLDEQRVKKAVNYIRLHFAEKITLEDIAADIHLSKSECCRCFKRSIGMTPFEYLMKYRIFEAANMLRDPAYAINSIADIAMSVGFNNLSYFSKLFGKYMSCTPRQYRNDTKSTHQVLL